MSFVDPFLHSNADVAPTTNSEHRSPRLWQGVQKHRAVLGIRASYQATFLIARRGAESARFHSAATRILDSETRLPQARRARQVGVVSGQVQGCEDRHVDSLVGSGLDGRRSERRTVRQYVGRL